MKKQIDPNLNSFDDELLEPNAQKEEVLFNVVGETNKEDKRNNPNFVVKECSKAENESDYHAHEPSGHSSGKHSGSSQNSHSSHHHSHHSSGNSHSHHHSSGNSHSHHHSSGHSHSHHHSSGNSRSHHHSSGHSHSHHHSSSHSHSHHHSRKKKMPIWCRILIILLAMIFLAVSVIGGTFLYLKKSGEKDLIKVVEANPQYRETIEYNGHTYVFDSSKVAFAFIGVDRDTLVVDEDAFGTSGQADTDIVGTIDTKTGEVNVITIPRDTMVDIDLYSKSGKFLRTEKRQICLSYAYGDGGELSCRNTTTAISRILGNVPIEKYFVLDLDGIAPLNDAIGGVTVTSLYDFPKEGVSKGETVKIKGDFAQTYVRRRDTNNIEASLNRTQRQTQYVKAYVEQLRGAVTNDFSVISALYDTAKQYSQTNITLKDVTYLATVVLSHGISGYNQYTIAGEMKPSSTEYEDVFAEYYVDEDSVMEAVVNCFYTEVK